MVGANHTCPMRALTESGESMETYLTRLGLEGKSPSWRPQGVSALRMAGHPGGGPELGSSTCWASPSDIRRLQWWCRRRSEQIARSYATPDEDIEPAAAWKLPTNRERGATKVGSGDLVELCRREVSKRRSKTVKRSAGVALLPDDGSGALRARGGGDAALPGSGPRQQVASKSATTWKRREGDVMRRLPRSLSPRLLSARPLMSSGKGGGNVPYVGPSGPSTCLLHSRRKPG